MSEVNMTVIQGRLVQAPVIEETKTGRKSAKFTVAWSQKINAEGEEDQLFLDCYAVDRIPASSGAYQPNGYVNIAGWIEKFYYLRDLERHGKGKGIRVCGKLKTNKWNDKNTGEKRSKIVLRVEMAEFAGGDKKPESNQDGGGPSYSSNYGGADKLAELANNHPQFVTIVDDDEGLPF